MGDEASTDTSSFLVTIERISRLGILRGLKRVRDCFGRKRGDVRQEYADYCAVVPWGLRWA